MVGLFSRFSRTSHRRSQSALDHHLILHRLYLNTSCSKFLDTDTPIFFNFHHDEREVLPPNSEITGVATSASVSHGIEVAVEFKPVEHPVEPLDNDRPIQCPLPEPSILNDGRIWKERVSATARRRPDLPVMKDGGSLESEGAGTKPRRSQTNRTILPSLSAPEHNILNLLEECNASGI